MSFCCSWRKVSNTDQTQKWWHIGDRYGWLRACILFRQYLFCLMQHILLIQYSAVTLQTEGTATHAQRNRCAIIAHLQSMALTTELHCSCWDCTVHQCYANDLTSFWENTQTLATSNKYTYKHAEALPPGAFHVTSLAMTNCHFCHCHFSFAAHKCKEHTRCCLFSQLFSQANVFSFLSA